MGLPSVSLTFKLWGVRSQPWGRDPLDLDLTAPAQPPKLDPLQLVSRFQGWSTNATYPVCAPSSKAREPCSRHRNNFCDKKCCFRLVISYRFARLWSSTHPDDLEHLQSHPTAVTIGHGTLQVWFAIFWRKRRRWISWVGFEVLASTFGFLRLQSFGCAFKSTY